MLENHDQPSTIRLVAILATSLAIAWNGAAAELTLEDRVAARRAIEEVYWQHRIWPEQSLAPKPPLSEVLPEEILRERVEDSLRLSRALAERWQRPITPDDLQAELDRMVRETTSPERLAELFDALGHDPQIIAEVLARPLLADRLVREAFASDPEIHGAVRRQIEAEYQSFAFVEDMWQASGTYREVTWLRWGDGVAKHELMGEKGSGERLFLDPIQWQEKTAWLDERMGDVALGEIGDLREDPVRLSMVAVLERGEARIRLAVVEWRKPELDPWWAAHRDGYASEALPQSGSYDLEPNRSVTGTPNSWQAIGSAGSPPTARSNHTATWTGSEMLVWGGDDGIGYVYSGSGYDPATSSWTAMTNTGHPLGRLDHTAVWTGGVLVVWGGDRGAPTDTGGRYNPTTNAWQGMTTTGAPSARTSHTAVTMGGNMFVWGGWNGSDYLGDGFKYRPPSDSWSVVDETDAPSPRSDHTAIALTGICGSGKTMIVFGGQNTTGILGDGARYCSFTDGWQALSSENAPSIRMGHSAIEARVANVNEMILWGGYNGVSDLKSGARWKYSPDPASQWRATTVTGAPSARRGHRAIWAGAGMMIWGGSAGATLQRSGGVYNVANSSWLPMTTSSAPTARKLHTVVWPNISGSNTGDLIVWGGSDGSPTATGGLYSRPTDFVVQSTRSRIASVPGGAELVAFRASVTSVGSFNNTVAMSYSAFPGNLMIWDDSLTPPTNFTAYTDVDLFVDAGAALGDHVFTIKGTSGITTHSAEVVLEVQDYQLSCLPSTVTIVPGGSTNANCAVSSFNSFDDPVALTCPQGVTTCTVSPSEVTPPRDGTVDAQLTISVGTSVAPGTYTVNPTAQSHLAERFSPIEVVVEDDGSLIFVDGFESGDTTAWTP